eukprot:24943-Chlamydomonas_euryale.AAC.1
MWALPASRADSSAASAGGCGATSPSMRHVAMTGHVSAIVKKQPVAATESNGQQGTYFSGVA